MSDRGSAPDSAGSMCTLTAITPVEPGREQALREELAGWGDAQESPMARVPRTHLARFIVIDRLPFLELRRHHLLFNAAFDAPWDGYPAAVHEALGDRAERIWGNCAGYPAGAGAARFAEWLLEHRIRARAVVAAYPDATLEDVRRALALRHRIGLFARRTQRRAPDHVLAAFEQEFGAL